MTSANQERGLHIGNARVSQQREKMVDAMREGVCPFCSEHFSTYHDAPVIYQGDQWFISANDYPYEGTRVHFLVIARTHITTLSELTPEMLTGLGQALQWIEETAKIPGGAFFMRFGDMRYTGATIAHLHGHVVSGDEDSEGAERIRVKLGFYRK